MTSFLNYFTNFLLENSTSFFYDFQTMSNNNCHDISNADKKYKIKLHKKINPKQIRLNKNLI